MEADNGLDARIAAHIDRRVEENRVIMRATCAGRTVDVMEPGRGRNKCAARAATVAMAARADNDTGGDDLTPRRLLLTTVAGDAVDNFYYFFYWTMAAGPTRPGAHAGRYGRRRRRRGL